MNIDDDDGHINEIDDSPRLDEGLLGDMLCVAAGGLLVLASSVFVVAMLVATAVWLMARAGLASGPWY